MQPFGARVRGLLSGILGPTVGALPWIGDRPGIVGPARTSTPLHGFLALTAVYYACSDLAGGIAQLPPAIYTTGDNGGLTKQTNTAAARALATLSFHDAELMAFSAALYGNGFLRVLRDGTGAPSSLVAIPTWRVSMLVDDKRRIFYKVVADATIAEDEVTLPEDQVVHVRFRTIGPNRLWGVPPTITCSQALGLALASRDVQRVLFANLSRPGGVLSAPGKIAKEVAKEIQASWDQNFSGDGAGRVAVISNGLEYKNIVWNATDAQLLETVKASVDDIANCYGIPASFMSSQTHLTYASSSEATRSKYVSALKPFAARVADAIARTLLSVTDRKAGAVVVFDLDSMLLPPGVEMATFVSTLVGAGVMTPNEARNLYLNLPNHADGDALRKPTATPTQLPKEPTP